MKGIFLHNQEQRRGIATLLALLAALCTSGAIRAADGCQVEGEVLVCPLEIGKTAEYRLDRGPAKSLKLVNRSNRNAQIYRVRVEPTTTDRWGEYCLFIRNWLTGQNQPGSGEVACTHKEPSEQDFRELHWDSDIAGPSVPSGSPLWIAGYVQSPAGKDYRKVVYVTAGAGKGGIQSFRQPQEDQSIRCSGASQATEHTPWRNTTGRSLTISGATIYAVDPQKHHTVDEACISVLDAGGANARWQFCTQVNVRGKVRFPPVVVRPDEYVAAQATNRCPAPGMWDWAAYIYVR